MSFLEPCDFPITSHPDPGVSGEGSQMLIQAFLVSGLHHISNLKEVKSESQILVLFFTKIDTFLGVSDFIEVLIKYEG